MHTQNPWTNQRSGIAPNIFRSNAIVFRVASILSLISLATASARGQELTAHQKLGREIYQQLIETDTTHSTGDTTKAAELLARRFRDTGFPVADVVVIGPTNRDQNLVVRYRGTGARRPVVFLAHLDVVEAKREDWSLDPFKLTEKDGFFYGRGTMDDKGGATTLSAALLRLRQENFQPDRDIILALTSGEEGGTDVDGAEWLVTKHRELVDGVVCFNADAGGPQKRQGTRLIYTVQAAEKIYLSFRLEVTGPGGHSSKPGKDNPIYELSAGLLRLSQFEFPVRLSEITRGYFERMATIETGQMAGDMRAILKTPPDPAALKRLEAVPFYNAILRTTAVATMIEGGHAENALPQRARATVNCRLLPDDTPENVEQTLRRVLADDKITITAIEPAKQSPASSLTPEVVSAIETAKEKLWPGLPLMPEMETGATDGLFFRQLGVPTYGITGITVDMDDIREHGKDERAGVKDFYDGLEFEYQLVKAVAKRRE